MSDRKRSTEEQDHTESAHIGWTHCPCYQEAEDFSNNLLQRLTQGAMLGA
jgi:hypothetical protein